VTNDTTLTGSLATSFAEVIDSVDRDIGENKTYGSGIGPHDEDDQIAELVEEVRQAGKLEGEVCTAKSESKAVRYPDGKFADLVLRSADVTEYCEAKLFRFQKANSNPSPRGYSKVFSPFQDHSPRSFVHDVKKLASAEIRTAKTLLGVYYRPIEGGGSDITGRTIAEKFATDVGQWTEHEITVDVVAPFEGLDHPVFQRGAVLTWELDAQPEQFF
jgi:hypothetical protein